MALITSVLCALQVVGALRGLETLAHLAHTGLPPLQVVYLLSVHELRQIRLSHFLKLYERGR